MLETRLLREDIDSILSRSRCSSKTKCHVLQQTEADLYVQLQFRDEELWTRTQRYGSILGLQRLDKGGLIINIIELLAISFFTTSDCHLFVCFFTFIYLLALHTSVSM